MRDWNIGILSGSHDRSGFDCGVEVLNHYLQRLASQDVKRRACAVYTASEAGSNRVIGYYTINASSAHFHELPEEVARKLPRYPDVPAFLIGRLAVSREVQGSGLGKILLMDALLRCLQLSDEVGASLVLVDAKDEQAAKFYRRHQFQELDGKRLFLPLSVVAKLK